MKKILHIPNYYNPHIGGIEQTCEDFVNSIKEEYEQKIICFKDSKKTSIDNINNVEVIRVGCQTKIMSQSIALGYKKELKKVFDSFNPDIVVFHYPNPYVAFALLKHLKNKKFKFILYWHLDITKQKLLGKLFSGQTKKLLNYADKIVTTSYNYVGGSNYLPTYYDKIKVINSCVALDRTLVDENIILKANLIKNKFKNKNLIFTFGRHVEYKGFIYLIEASKYLNDDFKILIGGSGPLTKKFRKKIKNDEKVELLGKLPLDDLKAYLIACDIFSFPSITRNEAFGLSLAEAMSFSKPAVTFNIEGSGVNFIALNGYNAIEVANKDSKLYAKAIERLASDKKLNEMMSLNAKKRYEKYLTFDVFKDNIKKLLIELGE